MTARIYLFLLFFTLASATQAQTGFQIKRYSIGYRISEMDAIGTNPLLVSPLLKDPVSYNQFISGFTYNGLSGNPAIQTVHSFYANAEFYKRHQHGFWKNMYLQGGMFVTSHLSDDAGGLDNHYLTDTTLHNDAYTLRHHTQYAGLNLGINRSARLVKRLRATIGLQLQGSIALVHYYQQRVDSAELRGNNGVWTTTYSKQLPDLQGRHYFQWQVALPLGIEYLAGRKITLRAEVAPGYLHNKYRNKSFAAGEAHSAGFWVIYNL